MSKIGKRAILLLLALPIGFNVMAQEIKKLTLEDLIPGGETYRYAENLSNQQQLQQLGKTKHNHR